MNQSRSTHRYTPCVRLFQQSVLKQSILCVTLGILLGLSLAPAPTGWLAWGAIAPLWVVAVQARSFEQAAGWGLCWGIGYHGAALSWITGLHPLTWMGLSWFTSLSIAGLSWGIATLWGALLPSLWAVGVRWLDGQFKQFKGWAAVVAGAVFWCALEWLWSLSPLWWTDLANSQSPHNVSLLHLSRLSGPSTIALALMIVNGAIALAWLTRQRKTLLTALLIGLGCYGLGWGLAQGAVDPHPNPPVSIGMIQGNIPTRFKLSAGGIQRSIETYQKGYEALATQGVDAILLPEGALPFLWKESGGKEIPILESVRQFQIPFWVGTFVPKQDRYTQSLLSLTGDGTVMGQYDKIKLVPLGEYLPFESLLAPLLRRLSPIKLGMEAGNAHQVFKTPFGQAIVGICYDSVFSDLFRTQAAAGGQFILSIANNDPYSRRMMAQHHALDVLRAIEIDRWLVRVTNTGLSAVIHPHGQTLWLSPINTFVTHIAKVERRTTQTLYVRWGNWLVPSLGAMCLALWGQTHWIARSPRFPKDKAS